MEIRVRDIKGQTFGRLTAIKDSGKRNVSGNAIWECLCDCGQTTFVDSPSLTRGKTKSCGCYAKESSKERFKTHGCTKTRLFRIWSHMIGRCYTKTDSKFYRYGGRGITVCPEWRNSFENFRDWALENGYSEDLTIDRINNDENYDPLNCRWATAKEQSRNTGKNRKIEMNGEIKCLSEWSEEFGIKQSIVTKRLKRGWTTKQAFTLPVGTRIKTLNSNGCSNCGWSKCS